MTGGDHPATELVRLDLHLPRKPGYRTGGTEILQEQNQRPAGDCLLGAEPIPDAGIRMRCAVRAQHKERAGLAMSMAE